MTADYFDQWYADIDASPLRRQIFAECLGLPPEVEPSDLVPLSGLHDLVDVLGLGRDLVLVDVACGRGGPGMWLARESGARVTGVDFSPVAIDHANRRRAVFGLETRAEFVVGDLIATGLPSGTADAVVCIDAFQFAKDSAACAAELRRLLKPGGRVALTGWHADDPDDPGVSPRLRRLRLGDSLAGAGFLDVAVIGKPDWKDAERRMWQRAVATPADGDPAVVSMHDEAARVLPAFDRISRVLVTGRAPL